MKNKPPSEYVGDEKFQKLFGNLSPEMMPVHEIRMFLLGFILAPEMVSFDWMIEEMLLVGTHSEITFKTEKLLQQFIDQIMALWNSLVADVDAKKIPKLIPLPVNLEDTAVLLKAANIRMNEIDILLGSLFEGGIDYKSCPDKNAAKIMAWLEKNTDTLEDYLERTEEKKPSKRLLLEIKLIMLELEDHWATKYKVLEEGLRKVRLAKLTETPAKAKNDPVKLMREGLGKIMPMLDELERRGIPIKRAPDKTVGRNDICSCGSGKKFKKCCGLVH